MKPHYDYRRFIRERVLNRRFHVRQSKYDSRFSRSETKPEDLGRPGHINPLRARWSVLIRAGHTEATVDLAQLSGLYPAGALIEIINEDGTMAPYLN